MRKAIASQLERMEKTRYWLAQQTGMRPASLYDFLSGRTKTTASDKVERMFDVLGLEIRPKRQG